MLFSLKSRAPQPMPGGNVTNKLTPLFLLGLCASFVTHADLPPLFKPFVSGEGSYSWPRNDGVRYNLYNIASMNSSTAKNGWGGRIAAGILHPMTERFSVSAELGGGYYGNSHLDPHIYVVSPKIEIIPPAGTAGLSMNTYGLDLLAGVVYTQPEYDLFFKAGAFFENMKANAFFDLSRLLQAGAFQNNPYVMSLLPNPLPAAINTTQNVRMVLPEIKPGVAWHLADRLVVTGAWMHTFGNRFFISNTDIEVATPSLNVALFGIEYRFG